MAKPQNRNPTLDRAINHMLEAAHDLCTAADIAAEGDVISEYINLAIRLRDMAQFLDEGHSWPEGGAEIFDIRTKEKLN